jgi:CheY-like chemotaxis protein
MSVSQNDQIAEGTPNENYDPPTPLKTSLVPIVLAEALPPSLTGTTEVLELAEGADNVDYQDATLAPQPMMAETSASDSAKNDKPADKKGADSKKTDDKPANNAKSKAKAESQSDAQTKASDERLVLVVEDTVELGEVILATLENIGLKTAYATHGKAGLEMMRKLNPQLLIMDIGLPDITGWKMLDEVKRHYESTQQQLPIIIVITAYGDPANRLIGKLQNIYTYLLKPFTPDEVETIVKSALAGEAPPDVDDTQLQK